MDKTTLLLSGGPDSVTLAYFLKEKKIDFDTLTFLHNPRGTNLDEVNSAKYHAEKLGVKNTVFDASFLLPLYSNKKQFKFSLGGAKDCIPNNMSQAPLSVHLMLFMASMHSISHDISSLSWAIHQDDFLKVSEDDIEKLKFYTTELIEQEIGGNFRINTPFQKYYKQDVFQLAKELGLSIDKTISCFDSKKNVPCGKCIKCTERNNALSNSKLTLKDVWAL